MAIANNRLARPRPPFFHILKHEHTRDHAYRCSRNASPSCASSAAAKREERADFRAFRLLCATRLFVLQCLQFATVTLLPHLSLPPCPTSATQHTHTHTHTRTSTAHSRSFSRSPRLSTQKLVALAWLLAVFRKTMSLLRLLPAGLAASRTLSTSTAAAAGQAFRLRYALSGAADGQWRKGEMANEEARSLQKNSRERRRENGRGKREGTVSCRRATAAAAVATSFASTHKGRREGGRERESKERKKGGRANQLSFFVSKFPPPAAAHPLPCGPRSTGRARSGTEYGPLVDGPDWSYAGKTPRRERERGGGRERQQCRAAPDD